MRVLILTFFVIKSYYPSYILLGDNMNNYIEELFNICKIPLTELTNELKVIIIGDKIVYISNFKKIIG